MPRVLITGADGFTGVHLVRALLDSGHEVHGLLRGPGSVYPVPDAVLHYGDLRSVGQLTELIHRIQPEKVIHLAAISFVAHGNADEIYDVNLLGTRHLLETLVALQHRPRAILLASSANVYGNGCAEVIDENTPPNPANDYAVSKLAMEYLARLYCDRLPITIVRPFNYTGIGQSKNFLIPKIVDHVRRRADVIELGNIDVERDWSDVRRVVQAYARLIACDEAIGKTFNICSGTASSLRDILVLAEKLGGHHMDILVNPALVRPNEVRSLRGSTEALADAVGPLPSYSLEDTLLWMLTADPCA